MNDLTKKNDPFSLGRELRENNNYEISNDILEKFGSKERYFYEKIKYDYRMVLGLKKIITDLMKYSELEEFRIFFLVPHNSVDFYINKKECHTILLDDDIDYEERLDYLGNLEYVDELKVLSDVLLTIYDPKFQEIEDKEIFLDKALKEIHHNIKSEYVDTILNLSYEILLYYSGEEELSFRDYTEYFYPIRKLRRKIGE